MTGRLLALLTASAMLLAGCSAAPAAEAGRSTTDPLWAATSSTRVTVDGGSGDDAGGVAIGVGIGVGTAELSAPSRTEVDALAAQWSRALADAAVALGRSNRQRWLLVLPADEGQLEELLGRAPQSLSEVPAVTMPAGTGDDAAVGRVDARLWVNRSVFGRLSDDARALVLRHEAVHVVLNDPASPQVPLWLQEGVAELVAHGAESPSVASASPPPDSAFADPTTRADAYRQAWAVCAARARELGLPGLLALRERVPA